MQVIFDENLIPKLKDRYILLELDTVFHNGMVKPIILHAVVEYPSIEHFHKLSGIIEQHKNMIVKYKNGNWDEAIFECYCLKGSWLGELDEFYDSVIETCTQMRDTDTVWDGVKYTTPTE